MQSPMSTKRTRNGTDPDADSDLPAVTRALRSIVGDRGRVTLSQIVEESGLSPAAAERAMGAIERRPPVAAVRIVEPGELAWRVRLSR